MGPPPLEADLDDIASLARERRGALGGAAPREELPGETGGLEIYARRLLPALARARPELDMVVFASREGAPSLRDEFEVVEVP